MKQKLWKYRLPLIALLLALLSLFCLWRLRVVSGLLESQKEAERWRGSNDQGFAQISCFMPANAGLTMEELYTFRSAMAQKLKDASFDVEHGEGLYSDAWCTARTVRIGVGRQSGDVGCFAVGGRFFDFHPLRLLGGNYLSPLDVMDDRVLLDAETAWMLFGASDVAGMTVSIGGTPYVVAGVYEHEKDSFSRHAADGGMRIYMSYEAYRRSKPDSEKPAVTCYEFVMAEPVRGFAYSAATEKFPISGAVLIENGRRFEAGNLLRLAKNGVERSMRKDDNYYPYWENAARAAEDRAVVWLIAALVLAAFPVGLLLVFVIRSFSRGKKKFETELFPKARDRAEEAIRVRARRRWEKQHPGED